FLFFFFSSRRRHTRFSRDWSSDVCSSDLISNSLTWAGIWPLALDGLGRFTKMGASLMIMGLCGNAILPLIYGHFADAYGLREAYWVLFPCYLYLVYYAVYAHKIRKWSL